MFIARGWVLNPLQGEYWDRIGHYCPPGRDGHQIHPGRVERIDSVKINPSLVMMRECTVLQGLTQPKVSGYRNFSICTPLRYSYATFGLCAEIVDAPSYRLIDLEGGLDSFNWWYDKFGTLFP